jgi:hypothetical protein
MELSGDTVRKTSETLEVLTQLGGNDKKGL